MEATAPALPPAPARFVAIATIAPEKIAEYNSLFSRYGILVRQVDPQASFLS